ncbi:MAG: LuxR C-terminal-related transcriptional regulator [Rhizobiaceae bacterium]|nr:LuxR C-terminal-related transcriptional regulator [Rhizobiaceae bacterium]
MTGNGSEREKQGIIQAIEGECAAFYERDFDRWAKYWVHDEDASRLATIAGGQIVYRQGWDAESAMIARIMRDHPTPNYTVAALVRRENMRIRINGDMAWASFDQYGPTTDDIFVAVGLSHQVRVFERQQDVWKIIFAGHADTMLETINCPSIHVDQKAAILWMNDAAKSRLVNHPALTTSRGFLRALNRSDDRLLRETLALTATLTPMDVRRSVVANAGNLGVIPLVLGDDADDNCHIIWVLHRDQMILVSFNDQETERKRLSVARSVYGLSEGQMRVAALIVEGHDIVKTAKILNITTNTARTHLQRMFDKIGVRSQTSLVRILLSASEPGA